MLRGIQNDEAHNCALIGRLLEKEGTPYSHATGEFYDKAVAVRGPRERIEFLVRGLRWAVRNFEQALPGLPAGAGRRRGARATTRALPGARRTRATNGLTARQPCAAPTPTPVVPEADSNVGGG